MSSIRDALERLDQAVGQLELSAMSARSDAVYAVDAGGTDIDPEFLAARIDRAIACVEILLSEGV
ncbi:MAG: hypothetical protein KJ017_02580 [Alphaproteobacteria bacterium]|nr:hypothetical protein [Alphaproteobacteria bacterium]